MATKLAPQKPPIDVARAYVDQIVLSGIAQVSSTLRLGELAQIVGAKGLSLTDLRRLLATNPQRFLFDDRRWVPAARVDAGGGPASRFIEVTLKNYGVPMPCSDVARELSQTYGRELEYFVTRLPQMLSADPALFQTARGEAGLAEWLFIASASGLEDAVLANRISVAEIKEFDWLSKVDFSDLSTAAEKVLARAPVSPKVVGFYAAMQLNPPDPYAIREYDAVELFNALASVPGYVFAADGNFHPSEAISSWVRKALKEAEKIAPAEEIEETAPLELGSAEIDEMVERVLSAKQSASVSDYLSEKYELTPADRTYTEDLATAVNALREDQRVWWVGADRFRAPDSAPEFILSSPDFFAYTESEFRDADGELIDVEMSDDAFTSALRKEMNLPLAQDVGDEEAVPRAKKLPDVLRLVLKAHHREIGTFPLCQIPAGWLPDEPPIQEVVLRSTEGKKLHVWVNLEAGLFFGLIDWWFEQPIESGAVFTLSKTDLPGVYDFAWEDEPDPLVFIPSERMNELRDLSARAAELSCYEILIEVLTKHSKGADFITILSEANVVRRMSRRQVASVLSGYHCFYQRSGSTVWHYDQKKVDQGFDRAKRKFVRR